MSEITSCMYFFFVIYTSEPWQPLNRKETETTRAQKEKGRKKKTPSWDRIRDKRFNDFPSGRSPPYNTDPRWKVTPPAVFIRKLQIKSGDITSDQYHQ